VVDARLHGLQRRDRKRVGHCQHTLCAMVKIAGVFVFEIDCMRAGQHSDFNILCTQVCHALQIAFTQRRDQQVLRGRRLDGMRKIKGSATRHVQLHLGRHYFIAGDVANTADVVHRFSLGTVHSRKGKGLADYFVLGCGVESPCTPPHPF